MSALGAGAFGTLAAGCGDGDSHEVAGVGTGGTGQVATFTSGPISGFGSVIVNGIRFDDNTAVIVDELGRERKHSELGLGMIVEIDGTVDANTRQGVARSIRVVSLLAGQVGAIDAARGRFTVMAMTVSYDTATMWNADEGASALRVGDRTEVWGFFDVSAGLLHASRVEILPAAAAPTASVAKVRGTVIAFDVATRWLSIDGQSVDLRDLRLPDNLTVGATVAAVGSQIAAADAPLRATMLSVVPAPEADTEVAIVENVIARWQSLSRFRLLDTWVDASSADIVGGRAIALRNGVRVRATGERVAGTLRATRIEVRSLVATVETNGNANVNANAETNQGTGNGNGHGNGPTDSSPGGNDNATGGGPTDTGPPPPPYVVDKVRFTGKIVAVPGANRIRVMDASMRTFTVDTKGADIVGGRRSDLDRGATVRVTGRSGSPIDATDIRIVRKA